MFLQENRNPGVDFVATCQYPYVRLSIRSRKNFSIACIPSISAPLLLLVLIGRICDMWAVLASMTRLHEYSQTSVSCHRQSDGLFTRHVNLFSALTSETRHATNTCEIHHFTTLLNSGDPATLLPGTRHALVKSVGAHVQSARGMSQSQNTTQRSYK
jgi:hypothetical protein